jgi:hypothetical protein
MQELCQDCENEGQTVPAVVVIRDPRQHGIIIERSCQYHYEKIRRADYIQK